MNEAVNESNVMVLTSAHQPLGDSAKESTAREVVDIQLPSELRYLNEVLNWLVGRAAHFRIIDPESSNLLVALDEAISNAIRHGNQNDPTKLVYVHAEFCDDEARFTVRDEGGGFDCSTLPDPCDPENLFREGGRGVLLIRHIMDEVHFNGYGNEVTMIKRAERVSDEDETIKAGDVL
jgi:serine/threonine-protein kinase RsbW